MKKYPSQLTEIIKDEFFKFFKNRFSSTLQYVEGDGSIDQKYMSAKITLKGEKINGTLAVNASKETLLQCHPERRYGDEITDEDLVDWIGEIVNRNLGNMKNRLFDFGIETTLNPPVHSSDAFTGDQSLQAPVISFVLSNGKDEFLIIFQAVISDDVEFKKTA